ncbi:putative Membrane protein [Pseudomonas caricapapayae]|uniref:Putative Membrane protein n=1 Tax=Pseudomonas caricapapayae TaxID=46678 RepID=A0A3M6F3L0_9PSED|nr:hypothetical protein [Pseudomonas caricapapayae]RMV74546.1 putative Membrane protein [Pseudomonas caricapapayae]
MKNIHVYLFALLMMFASASFADEATLTGTDCNRPATTTELNRCMEKAIENTPYVGSLVGMLKTPISVLMVNFFGNHLAFWGDSSSFHLTYDEGEKDFITIKKDTMMWGIKFLFLFIYVGWTCLHIFKSQAKGFLGSSKKDVVYYTLTSLGVLILLGFGTIFDFYAGSILTAIAVGLSFIVTFVANFFVATQADIGHVTTEANAYSRQESTLLISNMIKQQAKNILYGSQIYNRFNFNKTNETGMRIFEENDFSTCMAKSVDSSRFLSTLLLDGETQKTEKCLRTIGYKTFNMGNVSYSGKEDSTRQALLQMNDMAQMIALDSIKLMCGNALNVENRRVDWETSHDVYNQCIERISTGEVGKGANGEIKFFDQNDGITEASIQAQIEQMRQIYIAASTQFVANHAKDAVTAGKSPLVDIASFALYFATAQNSSAKLEQMYEDEFGKFVTSIYDPTVLGTADMAGLTENTNIDNDKAISQSLKLTRVFDINQTIDNMVIGSLKSQVNTGFKNSVEYTANLLFGDLYKIAGMTFEDCTKEINTCIAPVLNQSAAEFSNGIKIVKFYWSTYIISKVSALGLAETSSQATKSIGRSLDFLAYILAIAIAFLTSALVISGLVTPIIFIGRYAQSLFMLPANFVKMCVRLFSLIIPHDDSEDQEKSFHVFMDLVLSLLWIMLEPLVILFLMVVTFSIEGIISVFIGWLVYFACMPLIDTSGMIGMAVSLVFMMLVYASLTCYVKVKLASTFVQTVDSIQGLFKAEVVSDATGSAIGKYHEISQKLEKISRDVIR